MKVERGISARDASYENARRNAKKKVAEYLTLPTLEVDKEPDKHSGELEVGELEDVLDTIKCIDAKLIHETTETADRNQIIFLLGKITGASHKKANEIMEGCFDENHQ